MCCRTNVYPLEKSVAISVLETGLFVPTYRYSEDPNDYLTWERKFLEEGTSVIASLSNESFSLSITPTISIYHHHLNKRLAAGTLFEIAAKYAEKVGGEIIQRGLVSGCRDSLVGNGDSILASYPSRPLFFDNICAGFKAVILGESQLGGNEF